MSCHGLDTPTQVFFYLPEFSFLSNFSAFTLRWRGLRFDTAEAAYHWEKFPDHLDIQQAILAAQSAQEALEIARRNKHLRRSDWTEIKVDLMLNILRAKAAQHEYVRRMLLATDARELIENSWIDGFWGWGADHFGQNVLGKLWMIVRIELRNGQLKGVI